MAGVIGMSSTRCNAVLSREFECIDQRDRGVDATATVTVCTEAGIHVASCSDVDLDAPSLRRYFGLSGGVRLPTSLTVEKFENRGALRNKDAHVIESM